TLPDGGGRGMKSTSLPLRLSVFIAMFLTYSIINSTGQFHNAYHTQDDCFLHIPGSSKNYMDFSLSEGRWLNYLWTLISYHLSPELSYITFTILYGLTILVLTARLIDSLIFPLLYIAFFFSPFVLVTSLWSSSLIPAMAVFFLTALALDRIVSPV